MLKNYSKIVFITVGMWLNATSCKTLYPAQEIATLLPANKSISPDSSIKKYYQPYKDSLDKIMNAPIIELSSDLYKKQPESTLGNLMVDMLKAKAEDYTKDKIDLAILNFGGIRMSSLSKGMLKVEDAYLLMPFDNYVVKQKLTGQQVADFCDSIARMNGWPVSGISFKIKDKKAIDIKVNNAPLDYNKIYSVALIDYIANGGDGMAFLKLIPQVQTGKLFRDAILEFWKEQAKEGKKISSTLENRISYAE